MTPDLPRLLLIADGFAGGRTRPSGGRQEADAVRRVAARLVAAGVRWVSLRDHHADDAAFGRAAARLAERIRDIHPDTRLAVHGRAETARRLRTDLHVGRRGATLADALAVAPAVGVSAHSADEVIRAAEAGAAYATLSPVFRTATHPEATPLGLDALAAAVAAAPPGFPVLALGGVSPDRARDCRAAGAHGVAVLSGLLDAHRADAVAARYLDATA